MTAITLPNAFKPRAYQRKAMAYFDRDTRGGKRAMAVWHRRSGKDLTFLHQTCKEAHKRKASYWHIFPSAEQARKALWTGFTKDGERIMEQVFPRAIRKSPRDFTTSGEMVVELKCGSIWRLMGSDRMEIVGAGPAGVVFSEFALSKPRTWDLVRPMLRETDGWAAFITTPRGNNHAKKLFDMAKADPSWFCDLKTLYDTRAYDPEQTIAEESASGMPLALIRQEYLCDWTAANVGSVYGDLIEALEKRTPALVGAEFEHPDDGVFTVWDLGFTDATGIWFFRIGPNGVDVVDHYEAHGQPLSHYFDVLDAKPYKYVKHWLPHDARAKTLQTGASIIEQFAKRYGAGNVAIGPELSIMDGIQAARWFLQQSPRFHARCEPGVEALKAYRYAYDEDAKVFTRKPVHDWSSHTADAFRGLGCVIRHSELLSRRPDPEAARRAAAEALRKHVEKPQTLGEPWEIEAAPRSGRI